MKSEGDFELKEGEIHDAVWGVIQADGPTYRNVRPSLAVRLSAE